MIKKIKTKKAFTLAELTVALSIVGVLAAIVVPAVHNMAPNKEMIMFKKAYGEFVRITSEMVNNDDIYPESFDGKNIGFSNTDGYDFRGVKAATAKDDVKFCYLFTEHASYKGSRNCSSDSVYNITTNDGVAWDLPVNNFDSARTVVIDVNGTENLPNSSANSTPYRDRFSFTIDRYGKINITDDLTKAYLTETDLSLSQKEVCDKYGISGCN